MSAFRLVIPARLRSTRLPRKPLADLGGRPMIVRVWEQATASGARSVTVAADDEEIAEAVRSAGGEALLTGVDLPSGTDRVAAVARHEGWADDEIVVNVQGDEPFFPAELPAVLANALGEIPEAGIATAAARIDAVAPVFDPNVVKVVTDDRGLAMTFSRAPVPWVRESFDGDPATLPAGVPFLRHIGMYAYRVRDLLTITAAAPAPIEVAEKLEQLRAMALGIRIHVTVLAEPPPAGIDTPDDLERARAHLSDR